MVNFVATKVLAFVGGSPAFRSNVVNSAFDTLCAILSFLAVETWTSQTDAYDTFAAMGSAVMYAVSPLIWTYAISSEVFAMNNFFASLLIYLAVRYLKWKRKNDLFLGAFVCGLALTNQHTIILFEIPLIISVLLCEYRMRSDEIVRTLGQSASWFLMGLLPYMYLPISTLLQPVDGGGWGDTTSVRGLIRHIRRADYGTFALYSGNRAGQYVEGLPERLEAYVSDLCFRQTLGFLIIPFLMLVGVFYGTGQISICSNRRFQHKRKLSSSSSSPKKNNGTIATFHMIGRVLIGTFTFYMLVFHSLSNLPLSEGLIYGVHARFWQQPNVIVFMFLSCGTACVTTFLSRHFRIDKSMKKAAVASVFVSSFSRKS